MFGRLRSFLRRKPASDADFERQKKELLRKAPVPTLWLFGKTGSGKTSIVRSLTGADDAEIGNGYRPETRFSREYDFPTSDAPVLRFVDTRGLGEAHYDPAEDIAKFSQAAHLVIVVARAMDHALAEVVEPLRKIRRDRKDRPVLLVLTCLHEAYPGTQHPDPDPYAGDPVPRSIPDELRRSIQLQRERFDGLVDEIAPIDLTREEDGFDEPQFGAARLTEAIVRLLPAAYRQAFAGFEDARKTIRSLNERRAMPDIYSHSVLAATAAAFPIPWIDMPAVLTIQGNLVRRLAALYGQDMSSRLVADFLGAAGGRMAIRLLIREPLKAIPILGSAANAALAFAYTFGLGRACCWYFGELRKGNTPSKEEIESVWSSSIDVARRLWSGKKPDADS